MVFLHTLSILAKYLYRIRIYVRTYIRVLNIGGVLIWRSVGRSAKAPNLIPRQIFRLYGIRTELGVKGGPLDGVYS